jgi:hypothetical protein
MFLAVLKRDNSGTLEVSKTFIENDPTTVAVNLENAVPNLDYYQIEFNGAQLQATLHPVNIKAGPRTAAPAREVVEIEANGQNVGSAVIEV